MALTAIQIRRRVSGGAGAPSALKTAELAYNMSDGKLYIGYGDDGSGNATSIKVFAQDNYVDPSGVYLPLTATLNSLNTPTADFSMGSHKLTNLLDPTSAQDAATKNYVDAAITGMDPKPSVRAATTAALPTVTATSTTLTATANGALAAQDGVTLLVNERLLVKNQAAAADNGIYIVTQVGTGGTPFILTRVADMDSWAEVPGAYVFVEEGTANGDKAFLATSDKGGTLGTTAINWSAFGVGGSGFTIAGSGLTSGDGITVDVNTGAGITITSDAVALTGNALAMHNVTVAADKMIYATGASTFAATDLTSVARTLLAQTTQANMRSTGLGLGTMSTQNANAVAITGGTIDGVTLDGGTF